MIKFTINLTPKTMQSESRIGFIKPKGGIGKGHGMMFSTAKKKAYLLEIAHESRPHAPKVPWEGPIHLEMLFVLPRSQYAMAKKYEDGLMWADVAPDITNLVKAFEDGLSGAKFWKNDAQIVRAKYRKVFAEKRGFPRVEVAIEELGGPLL